MEWFKRLFKKKPLEKVRLRFRDGVMINTHIILIPAYIANNHIQMGMFSQWLYNYQFKLGQLPEQHHLGGLVGLHKAPINWGLWFTRHKKRLARFTRRRRIEIKPVGVSVIKRNLK